MNAFLAGLFAIFLLLPSPDAHAERVIRVGINDYAPLIILDDSGTPRGFFIDIIEDAAHREGWRIEYVEGTFQNTIDRLKTGEIDLGLGLSQTNERNAHYDFCREPAVSTWAQIYTRRETSIKTILDLKGKRIAYLRGDILANQFWELARQFGINSTYLEQNTVDEMFDLVRRGRADACICERIGGEAYKNRYSLIKSPIIYFPSSLFYATTKGKNRDILSALDRYFQTEKTNPASHYNQIVSRWLEEETQWRMPGYLVWIFRITILVLLLFGVGAVLQWLHSRRLQQVVRDRTSELYTVNRQMRAILDNASIFIGLLKPDGTLVEINRSALEFAGIDAVRAIGKPLWDTPWWTHSPEMQSKLRAAISFVRDSQSVRFEATHIDSEGNVHDFDFSIAPICDETGRTVLLVPEGYDISGRKRAERALKESEEKFSRAFHSSPVAIMVTRRHDGILVEANETLAHLIGYPLNEIIGKTSPELGMWENVREWEELLRLADTIGTMRDGEYRLRHRDGSMRIARYSAEVVEIGNESCLLSVLVDITGRKRAEEELRKSEARYRSIVENIDAALYIHDFNGTILDANDHACRMTGYDRDELTGMHISRIDSPDASRLIPLHMQRLLDQGKTEFDIEHVRKDGGKIPVTVNATVVSRTGDGVVQSIVRDIAERRQLEEQLRQAQKMESVGRLAGGVAHDFNNILTSIIGSVELSLMSLSPLDPIYPDIKEIMKSAERAANLTRQLLAFSRKQIIAPQKLNLNEIIRDMERMLRRIIGEHLEFRTIPCPDLQSVKMDPGQIEQVLTNLVVNARDAMPEGGTLTIETANVMIDRQYAELHPDTLPGAHVMLAVSDTGVGMDQFVREHLFEPFFTTKEMGKGTGLGMATCYGIIKQNCGSIYVYSEPGAGTVVKVFLPVCNDDREAGRVTSALSAPGKGSETVLVAEDEPSVRNLIVKVLRMNGYTVLEAGNGEEALAVASHSADAIRLLITDVVMPTMGGKELSAQLRERISGLRTIYISGHTDNSMVKRGILERDVDFLQKPFTTDTLARKVREVLDAH